MTIPIRLNRKVRKAVLIEGCRFSLPDMALNMYFCFAANRHMLMRYFLFLFFVLNSSLLQAQEQNAPADNTAISKIKHYKGDYSRKGYKNGQKVPNIVFYTEDNKAVSLNQLLQDKMPVLLVSGSYTCPDFRLRAIDLNTIADYYKGKMKTYLIYTLEAHPSNAICPYMDSICIGRANYMQHILYPQQVTYGDRKAMVDTMKTKIALSATILLDGPKNEWWRKFGPAPNVAYLIDTNRIVKGKNLSLNAGGENIWCDIDRLLGTTSGHCRR